MNIYRIKPSTNLPASLVGLLNMLTNVLRYLSQRVIYLSPCLRSKLLCKVFNVLCNTALMFCMK